MKNKIIEEFDGGKIWDHCIESANELVAEYIKSVGGDEPIIGDVLETICKSEVPLNRWNGYRIIELVGYYI